MTKKNAPIGVFGFSRTPYLSNYRAKWAGFEYAGDEPTLEEFILWMAGQVR